MAYMRNVTWKEDNALKRDMEKYVRQDLRRKEILDFLERDYSQYSWSFRSLDRRLRHFDIYYVDQDVTVEQVKGAVEKEVNGPGKLLGYRAMQKKLRQEHGLNVPRDLVHAVMYDVDPEGLNERGCVGTGRKKKGNFTTKGPNWVHSLDGHDKLMGFQNSTYPLAVYGCLDTASRKILWLRIWVSNSDPLLIGRWYLQHILETRCISSYMRLDKGTETGTMATIHAFLRQYNCDGNACNTVLYGPSTSNQIERWWKELHERLEKYFKEHLRWLKDHQHYNPHDETDRSLLAFLFIPMIQRQLDIFKDTIWNSHRIRFQKDTNLPNGVPNHIYSFPEQYGLEECGNAITEEQLEEVAEVSGVLQQNEDFISPEFRAKCEQIIPFPEKVEPNECKEAFMYLKDNFALEN